MRMRIALAAALAVAGFAFAASPAVAGPAQPSFDPQTTNVPYLAWRGEEIRLVKCEAGLNDQDVEALSVGGGGSAGDGSVRYNADWIVEDWSGIFFQPPSLEANTVKFMVPRSGEHAGDVCVKANFVSQKAGLAMIKLVVSDAVTGNPVVKHQFLAGWLGLNAPRLDIFPSGATSENELPGAAGNRLRARITGNLPLGNNFAELGLPASIQLPAENDGSTYWDELARRLASTSSSEPLYRDEPWRMWDIHDDQTAFEGHVAGACSGPAANIDAVDTCTAVQTDAGLFSRIWGDLALAPSYGPFDPVRADATFLGDGKLDSGDVPLPSARIDFAIAANTNAASDIGGVGTLSKLDKSTVYTRGTGHSLYAPYYKAYIPATRAELDDEGSIASGTDTADTTNNYPNYLACLSEDSNSLGDAGSNACLYDYWDIDLVLREAEGGDTSCVRRFDERPVLRQTPTGPQAVVVYSDEHGEAMVRYQPGLDFFFDAVLAQNGIQVNKNMGCDLEDVDTLGTSQIQAIARYPGQRVTDSDKASNTVTKTIGNAFHKDVTCEPKGQGINNLIAFICTAHAQDIDGSPFVDEKVCFVTNGEGAREFPLGARHTVEGLHRLCVFTNEEGDASIEVFAKCMQGNVIAEFVAEGLIRFALFTPACPPGGTGGTSVGGSSSSGPSGDVVVSGVPTSVTQAIIAKAQSDSKSSAKPAAKVAKNTLAFARIQVASFKNRSRYLIVRVNGVAPTAKIEIRLIKRNGHQLTKLVRTIRTNRAVRVLKVAKIVKTARVKVIG